jgi:hypothetical protein
MRAQREPQELHAGLVAIMAQYSDRFVARVSTRSQANRTLWGFCE